METVYPDYPGNKFIEDNLESEIEGKFNIYWRKYVSGGYYSANREGVLDSETKN